MSIIHEQKGIGVVTETEIILKNGQKVPLYEIGYAKYKSHFAVFWFINLILCTLVFKALEKDTLIPGIFMGIIFGLHLFKGPKGTLVIYNKSGGQIASQDISISCEGCIETFVEAINKHTK